ncbi:hypothetical protein INS49_011539 [Diaporthe citri]|uniref:uncharacterized protein n=1 Tax=Diaporthe citri TaxID=83186 RepID=UPI001C80C5AD|nr:uncharacterized protein INS49_011539 [Diaporthe citri]KAG6360477.1 hypothetical protein INS49_011539 [Diaporthe citri]
MAGLVDKLTASGGTENAGFLNDIVAQLWPNINVAGGRMIKEIVEPILASTLPGPLSSLRFVKVDLGQEPIRISEVDVHKTQNGGIKLDMDIVWDGKSDIDLEGSLVPKLGIKNIHLQVAFINPPTLKLDFTDAANLADCFLVDKAIRKIILNIVSSMAVLPNRFLVKLDNNNDYFKTYLPHLGALRLTVEKATGVRGPKKNAVMKLLNKIVKDIPDCYCKVAVGAEEEWRTSTKKDENNPEWNETHDFLVADNDQEIVIDVQDEDLGSDDDIGIATTTVKDILLDGGSKELQLFHNGDPVDARVSVRAQFYNFVDDAGILSSKSDAEEGQMVGLATVLIGSVSGLQGQRDELNPSVKVSWGEKEFFTAAKSYTPGTDIFNPSFDQAFRIPLTAALLANPESFKLTLLNKKDETATFEIPFSDILQAPGLIKEDSFAVGLGVTVRASISLRALRLAH